MLIIFKTISCQKFISRLEVVIFLSMLKVFLLKMKISEVINMSMESVDSEIEIVVDNEFKKFTFDLFVHGFHVYQTAWSPIIGEEDLECR